MIYLVTNNQNLLKSKFTCISIKESLKKLNQLSIIGTDTETSGIDVHSNDLLLTQFGCKDFQIVIDCRTIDINSYKSLLEDPNKLFLFWNAKFDLKFFLKFKIVVKNIYDGYLAEKLLYLGYPAGVHSMSLKSAGEYYCSVELDKSVRGKIIWSRTLTDDIIEYGAGDVEYLEEIYNKQQILLKQKNLLKAIAYENAFCPVLAYTEFCGIKLDEERWKEKMARDTERFNNAKTNLDNWVIEHFPESKWTYVNLQGDLWEGFDITPKCLVNWSSPQQVIPLFEKIGFNLETYDKKTKVKKKSVGADIIEKQKEISDIAPYYLEYKAAEKLVGTYGQNVLDQINPNTGRIHTNFNQLGTDTGRLSSGGKDKEHGVEYINFQNFPSDKETRSCFVSEPGYSWISCDYSAQESRIIGDISGDKSIIDLFNIGCGDMHSLVAKMAYPDVIGDCPVEEVKSKFKHYRQEAKGVEFAINYGGNAKTIMSNKNIPLKEAQKIYDDYMKGFPGVKAYQERQRKFVMDHGYILLNPKSGHKAFIYDWETLKAEQEQMTPEFWLEYNQVKTRDQHAEIVNFVRQFMKKKSEYEKQSINYPCQATGAVMFKLASIYIYRYLLEHNLLFKVKLCIPAHDEWNIEVPNEIVEEMTQVIQDCMSKAGSYFCTHLEVPAEAEVSDHWIH